MGGSRSGRSGRPSYESTASISLRTRAFKPVGLRFGLRCQASITYRCDGADFPVAITIDTTDRHYPFLELAHRRRTAGAERERYRVRLETTDQPFGGIRWWFRCPRTGRRAVCLRLPLGGHQFWGRHAYGLGYASQREDRKGRAQLQAQKLYAELGGDGHWMEGAPPKLKWMRWATYERKAAKLDAYNERFDAAWSSGLARLLARMPD